MIKSKMFEAFLPETLEIKINNWLTSPQMEAIEILHIVKWEVTKMKKRDGDQHLYTSIELFYLLVFYKDK